LNASEQREQKEYLEFSIEAVVNAFNDGAIPDKFSNVIDMSVIADFIYQGSIIGDEELQSLAQKVLENYARDGDGELIFKNYDFTEIGGGLDNNPAQLIKVKEVKEVYEKKP
jgi:hypothetical protein